MIDNEKAIFDELKKRRCYRCRGRAVASVGGLMVCRRHVATLATYIDNLARETARTTTRRNQ